LQKVKYAVHTYGMDGVSERNIGKVCGVDDSNLHRFFKNKEELMRMAYERESDDIVRAVFLSFDETKDIVLDFKTRIRLHFHKIWNALLSDQARLTFCVCFVHSSCGYLADAYHIQQTEILYERFQAYLPDRTHACRVIQILRLFLYDNAKLLTDSGTDNAPEYEEFVFKAYYALLCAYLPEEKT